MLVEYRTPAGPSAIQAWQSQEQQFAAQHQGYQRVTLTGDDQTATWEYTYSDGTQTLHAVDYAFILGNGKYGFALNWQSPDTEWDALQATFTAMRSTFINPPGT
jgi:hypothetical protein